MINPDSRHCTKCGRWLTLTLDNFYVRRGKFIARCKECCKAYKRGRYPYTKAKKFKQIVGV